MRSSFGGQEHPSWDWLLSEFQESSRVETIVAGFLASFVEVWARAFYPSLGERKTTIFCAAWAPVIRSALVSDGFDVCGEANNGREAIELAERLSPDLVILDVSMPVMNGLEAAPQLRKVLPGSPIILYTIYADKVVEQQLRTTQVDSVLSKREPLSRLTEEAHSLLNQDPKRRSPEPKTGRE